jgi:hypothetical protein
MRVRATMTLASGDNQRSTLGDDRRSATTFAAIGLSFACASAACGGAPEKIARPESPPSSSASAPPVEAPARAEPVVVPTPPAPSVPVTPAPNVYVPTLVCDVRGAPVLAKGINLWAEPRGTSASASFAGQPITVIASGFPADASAGRIRVRTSGGIRIDGFVDAGDPPMYTASDLAVVPGHLWIAQGQKVSFSAASSGIAVEAAVSGAVTQTFRVTAPCDALTLDKKRRVPWDVPGNGRGYLAQRPSLDLRDQPGGNVIQTLHVTEPRSGMLLWSTESQGGSVHVVYHEDLVIDAWVASSELTPLKQGETMDRLAPPSSMVGSARLSIGGQPTLVRAQKDVPLRLSPQDAAKPVGAIETGGEVYLIQTVLGWTSVLPKALNVLPPGERSFWVPSSEVGTAK